jgi:hypothetical protein
MVTIDTASATISQDVAKAKLACHIMPAAASGTGNPLAIGNMTENFSVSKSNDITAGHAWTATAEVGVTGPAAEVNTWDFGFMQFQRLNALNFFYAGLRSEYGGIAVNAHLQPAMIQAVCLDSDNAFSPWTHADTKGTKTFNAATGKVKVKTGDHPMHRVATMLGNDKTGEDNFLFQLIDDRDFWTVFVARDPAGTLQHLAHFHWHLRYEFTFKWRKAVPLATRAGRAELKFDAPAAGAPSEPSIQKLLKSPAQPQANSLMRQAILQAVAKPNTPNRKDTSVNERFGVIPKDFWT